VSAGAWVRGQTVADVRSRIQHGVGVGSPVTFSPNYFVEISATLELKKRALSAYASEMRPWPHARSLEAVEALAKWRGASAGVIARRHSCWAAASSEISIWAALIRFTSLRLARRGAGPDLWDRIAARAPIRYHTSFIQALIASHGAPERLRSKYTSCAKICDCRCRRRIVSCWHHWSE